jgi:homoprotocatechuate degradation regulator HpaR
MKYTMKGPGIIPAKEHRGPKMAVDAPGGAKVSGDARNRQKLRGFSQSLPMSLLRAREATMKHFRPTLRHFGFTEQQWRILRALAARAEIEVMELAEATYLLPPSVSRMLKDLEKRELILRRGSDHDMRRGIVSISPKGLRLIDIAGQYSETIYARITRRYGAEKLAALQAALHELEAVLSEAPSISESLDLGPPPARATAPTRRGRPPKNRNGERQ